MVDFQFLSILILLAWMMALFYLLGDTADAYFSPTLASICEHLRISYDVAGVTFLAFGNGAPDVFASIAAYTGGGSDDQILIGLNAVLGAGMFVTTVVVGVLTLVTPVTVQPRAFIRDVVCYICALSVLTYVLWDGSLSLFESLLFILLYVAYVSIVILGDILAKKHNDAPETDLQMGNVTSAFWHVPVMDGKHRSAAEGATSYSFLTIDDGAAPLIDPDEEQGAEVDGGFQHAIVEDYFESNADGDPQSGELGAPAEQQLADRLQRKRREASIDSKEGEDEEREFLPRVSGDMELPVMLSVQQDDEKEEEGEIEEAGGDQAVEQSVQVPRPMGSRSGNSWRPFKRLSKRGGSVWDGLYFSHLRWRHSTRKSLFEEVLGQDSKVALAGAILEWPLKFLRDITIPTVEDEKWSRLKAGGYPLFSSMFLLFVTGNLHAHVGPISVGLIVCLIGAIVGGIVYFNTHTSRPPRAAAQQTILILGGFLLCIGWIYTGAAELVALLLALGRLTGLPTSILGLTVLAWGNSLGDLISNVAVAKAGFADMAIAGCYGGPVFNLLMSIGTAFTFKNMVSYPDPQQLPDDDHVATSLFFLFVSLTTSCLVVILSAYRFPRMYGGVLIGIYLLYSLLNVLEALGAIEFGVG